MSLKYSSCINANTSFVKISIEFPILFLFSILNMPNLGYYSFIINLSHISLGRLLESRNNSKSLKLILSFVFAKE